ncbi:oligosaccharide repeat unit polymerase [Vibrio metschnikovii]|nr:oligosaccharide repeat unit polymerase [Vibrio metschnikovii]
MIYVPFLFFLFVLIYFFFSNKHAGFLVLSTFGLLYYIYSPYMAFITGIVDGFPGIENWSVTFAHAKDEYEVLLFLSSAIILSMYLFVDFFSRIKFPNIRASRISPVTILLFFIVFIGILFVIWFRARGLFFKGYLTDYSTSLMGQMATINLLMNFLLLYSFLAGYRKSFNFILIFILINSILLLSMGGRMYVVTIIVSWALYFSNLSTGIQRFKLVIFLLFFVLFFLSIGIFRLGIKDFSFLPYIFLGEPIFTSYSSSSFLGNNDIPVLGHISLYIKSYIGLLPSFFFSDKTQLYTLPQHMGYDFIAPLGATSIVVYLTVSFGVIGSPAFFILLSFVFTFIKKQSNNGFLWIVIYYTMLSIVPFILFRESFYVSTRALVLPSVVLPLLLLACDKFLKVFK